MIRVNVLELTDVIEKYKRKNQILFNRDSACLQPLLEAFRTERRRTLVLWAFASMQEPLDILRSRYPNEHCWDIAESVCWDWACGKVKMPEAKAAILEVHRVAKSLENSVDCALCHGVAQACSSVHTEAHAIGLAFYELTAVVRRYGIDDCENEIRKTIERYFEKLEESKNRVEKGEIKLAAFLMKDSPINKETMIYEKKRKKA